MCAGSSADISEGLAGRGGSGGGMVVPHTMDGSRWRVCSMYFWTEDFSASSAERALSFSDEIWVWVRAVEDEER